MKPMLKMMKKRNEKDEDMRKEKRKDDEK